MRFSGFIGPSYTLRSVNADGQACVNLYPELNELGTGKEREVAALIGTPGLSLLLTLSTGPVRGHWFSSTGKLYAVGGNKLYSISSSWIATEIGTLSTSTGPVSMADNGISLVAVDGPNGYTVDLEAGTFAQMAYGSYLDNLFPGSSIVAYQDGYFAFIQPDSEEWFISDLLATTINGLSGRKNQAYPDFLNSGVSVNRDLWMFGESSIEVWYNAGDDADNPFERVQGAVIEIGCAAPFSVAKTANQVFWVGKDRSGSGIVFSAQGYQPQRISTYAIENAIRGYGDISSTRAFCYQEAGHYFYCLNFPNASTTWAYDTGTKLWHERSYLNNGLRERGLPECHSFAYSKNVVGDYRNGNIYEMSLDVFTDNTAPIVRKRTAPHVTSGLKRVTHSRFQLDLESGVGLDGTGQGIDPQAMLRFSDDGGHSWSNEKWTGIGKIGQTRTRAIWRRLGMSRDRVYEISISDPNKVVILGAELDVQAEAS